MNDGSPDWVFTPTDWDSPEWNVADRIHNWRNYISEEIRAMWPTLNDRLRRALARQAQVQADKEEWD
jgi:hypothetical protein